MRTSFFPLDDEPGGFVVDGDAAEAFEGGLAEEERRMAESGEALRKTLEQTRPSEEWKQRVEQERQGMIRQLKQTNPHIEENIFARVDDCVPPARLLSFSSERAMP